MKQRLISLTFLLLLSLTVGCAESRSDLLFNAIREKNVTEVEQLLSKGGIPLDPPQQPNQVNKPLAYAAAYGNLDIVKLLLKNGADINGAVAYGDGPLIKAAEHNNKKILKYLIRQGADVNKPNIFGISSFIGLCASEDLELVRLALEYGGNINQSHMQGTEKNYGKKKQYGSSSQYCLQQS